MTVISFLPITAIAQGLEISPGEQGLLGNGCSDAGCARTAVEVRRSFTGGLVETFASGEVDFSESALTVSGDFPTQGFAECDPQTGQPGSATLPPGVPPAACFASVSPTSGDGISLDLKSGANVAGAFFQTSEASASADAMFDVNGAPRAVRATLSGSFQVRGQLDSFSTGTAQAASAAYVEVIVLEGDSQREIRRDLVFATGCGDSAGLAALASAAGQSAAPVGACGSPLDASVNYEAEFFVTPGNRYTVRTRALCRSEVETDANQQGDTDCSLFAEAGGVTRGALELTLEPDLVELIEALQMLVIMQTQQLSMENAQLRAAVADVSSQLDDANNRLGQLDAAVQDNANALAENGSGIAQNNVDLLVNRTLLERNNQDIRVNRSAIQLNTNQIAAIRELVSRVSSRSSEEPELQASSAETYVIPPVERSSEALTPLQDTRWQQVIKALESLQER